MFDFDPASKRAKLAIRFFTYGVMTFATVVISTVMVFLALGYRLDKNFHFTQGGLVQFVSAPNGASVTVDGALQGFNTPNKQNLSAGQHTVSMSLAGYRGWSKTVDLAPGQLLWLNYIRLLPTTVRTSSVREFDALADVLPSPDRHWLLLQPKNDQPDFVLADMSDEKSPKFTTLSLPAAQFTKQGDSNGTFTLVEWDLQSQYVLIKHQIADTTEFIRMDRSKPADAINISKLFGFAISEAHFSGNDANTVFVNNSGVLRRLDVGSQSASGALVNDLQTFVVYGSGQIAFSADREQTAGDATTKQRVLGTWRNDKTVIVRTAPAGTTFNFDYSSYDNHEYLVYADAAAATVTLLRDPSSSTSSGETNTTFAQFDLGAPVTSLSFSSNGRMVVAQNGNHYAAYDSEEAKTYHTTLQLGADVTAPLHWLDNFYLWSSAGGTLHWLEFDGTNAQDITSAQPGFGIMLSGNGQRLFSIGKNKASGKLELQSSLLTTNG